jgi:hypothetical protein
MIVAHSVMAPSEEVGGLGHVGLGWVGGRGGGGLSAFSLPEASPQSSQLTVISAILQIPDFVPKVKT